MFRKLKLVGPLAKQTIRLAGVQFVNGLTEVHVKPKDFEGLFKYLYRCWQVEEVKDGERATEKDQGHSPGPDVPSGVQPVGGGPPPGPAAPGVGHAESSPGDPAPVRPEGSGQGRATVQELKRLLTKEGS